jgi:hypothetical protein
MIGVSDALFLANIVKLNSHDHAVASLVKHVNLCTSTSLFTSFLGASNFCRLTLC